MSLQMNFEKKLGDFHLDLQFQTQSRRIGILGASGCGKSMTLKCIAGIEKPDAGHIEIDGKILFDAKGKVNPKPGKRNVGYLFQNYALFPNMTVRENISVGIKAAKKEKMAIADRYIQQFQLQGYGDRYPWELSGGQQQRVALARIMAYEPDVILLDEPFSALDLYLKDRLQHEMMTLLEEYEGTVIMVSHNRDEIYTFSDELLIMDQGKAVIYGKTKDIFQNPKKKEAARLTGCKNIVSIQKISDHTIFVPSWNCQLCMEEPIGENVRYLGVRAHDFLPVWGQEENNCIPVLEGRMEELPFEKKYYIKTNPNQKEEISCFLQRDGWEELEKKGMPDYLKIPAHKILLLE